MIKSVKRTTESSLAFGLSSVVGLIESSPLAPTDESVGYCHPSASPTFAAKPLGDLLRAFASNLFMLVGVNAKSQSKIEVQSRATITTCKSATRARRSSRAGGDRGDRGRALHGRGLPRATPRDRISEALRIPLSRNRALPI